MKVIDEIVELAKEHHQSLVLANQCINTSNKNNPEDIATLCEQTSLTFETSWKHHFETEEKFIFNPLLKLNTDINELVKNLLIEHKTLINMSKQLVNQNNLLNESGLLLRSHTRAEDRQLFPVLADHLTKEQLLKIQQTRNI